jgi:hypothetical protein
MPGPRITGLEARPKEPDLDIGARGDGICRSAAAYGSVVQGSEVCTQDPNRRLGSDDADIVRASQHQHAVEDMDRHLDFSRSTFVHTRAQPVTDYLLPSADGGLYFGASVVA